MSIENKNEAVEDVPATSSATRFGERFVLPIDGLWSSFEALFPNLPDQFKPLATVFKGNIESAGTVVTIPYTMAYTGAVQARFNAHLIAARIRARQPSSPEERAEAENRVYETASDNLHAELESPTAKDHLADSVIQQLLSLIKRSDFDVATNELLLETLVMVWGAFESFVSETIRTLVNSKPPLAAVLLSTESTRKHFPSRAVSVEDLANHDFNVAGCMGDLLLRDRHLDSLPVIKDVLSTIFPTEDAHRQSLNSSDLWLLWQRRHLIVHRRGIVDSTYLAKTSDTPTVGERLCVSARYVESSFSLIVQTAVELMAILQKFNEQSGKEV